MMPASQLRRDIEACGRDGRGRRRAASDERPPICLFHGVTIAQRPAGAKGNALE
jgi:hypothetical protein